MMAGARHLDGRVAAVGFLPAAAFAASLAGMTSPERIPGLPAIGVTGLGVGLVVVSTTPFLGGSGGKLGSIAFGACLGGHAALRRIHLIRLRFRGYVPPGGETT